MYVAQASRIIVFILWFFYGYRLPWRWNASLNQIINVRRHWSCNFNKYCKVGGSPCHKLIRFSANIYFDLMLEPLISFSERPKVLSIHPRRRPVGDLPFQQLIWFSSIIYSSARDLNLWERPKILSILPPRR